jgi:hypothetical protein
LDSRIFASAVIPLREAVFSDSFHKVLDSIFHHPQTVYTPNPILRTGEVEVYLLCLQWELFAIGMSWTVVLRATLDIVDPRIQTRQ